MKNRKLVLNTATKAIAMPVPVVFFMRSLLFVTAQCRRFLGVSACFLVLMSGWSGAGTESAGLTPAAQSFISGGWRSIVKQCDLVNQRCGKSKFLIVAKGRGESNDERRIWKTMKLPGLEVTAIFPVDHPRDYYLESVIVTSSDWPVDRGLGVGVSRQRVIAALGQAMREEKDGCFIYFSEETQADVTFCFTRGYVSKVAWGSLID